tara:strand:+ start:593 stop:1102 length:510 start_codon:yes stop_codon:yes gene_type:complete
MNPEINIIDDILIEFLPWDSESNIVELSTENNFILERGCMLRGIDYEKKISYNDKTINQIRIYRENSKIKIFRLYNFTNIDNNQKKFNQLVINGLIKIKLIISSLFTRKSLTFIYFDKTNNSYKAFTRIRSHYLDEYQIPLQLIIKLYILDLRKIFRSFFSMLYIIEKI